MTISLDSDDTYYVTETITLSEAIKNLVINGNNKYITGTVTGES
ncbi:hypothetical protein PXD04_09575 [Methanosphaera sp. ISO3-F5]|nr:hypothetical protein [Methanosphaera sp. ISO3-F5]WQH63937.1 hypothetical protein PXD04_09575 [Methanosphaera sp. ISO3-F5]